MKRGFTLIEIMVSIGIFVMVATVMLGALFGATDVFRRGEAARQAGDEATLVIAALREDLSRAVPARLRNGSPAPESGWMYARVEDATANCILSLVIENPDRAMLSASGSPTSTPTNTPTGVDARVWTGARQIVCWFVVPGSDPTQDELRRAVYPWTASATQRNPANTDGMVVTRGCLHFGVWFEVAATHRPVTVGPEIGWELGSCPPYESAGADPNTPLDTANTIQDPSGQTIWPQPDALRISLVLTGGGRFASRGTLIGQLAPGDTQARISGIKALPTTSGSLLRIGDEWIRYDDFRSGRITGLKRGQMRTTDGTHADRSLVLAGQPFSLVVALPR